MFNEAKEEDSEKEGDDGNDDMRDVMCSEMDESKEMEDVVASMKPDDFDRKEIDLKETLRMVDVDFELPSISTYI